MDKTVHQAAQSVDSPDEVPRLELENSSSFRRQEISFIKLNLSVIVALTLVHLVFGSRMGYPSVAAFVLLSARFAEQFLEWQLLRRRQQPLSPAIVRFYSWASPLAAIVFAFFMTVLSNMEDAHYHVLMVVPIIAAAVRFPLRWVLAFVALAGSLTILGVVIVNGDDDLNGIQEIFESITIVLIYFVVGIIVWIMSEHRRRDSAELRRNYAQLKSMHERLVKDERLAAVGRLASAIAHEIRNPVAAISSSLAAAAGESLPADVRLEMARIAAREATRLEKLTGDFLSYARAKPLELRQTCVADVVKYVADLVTARAAESSVAIKTECDADFLSMMDDFQIHGALLNLAINAIDASPKGFSVVIGACLRDAESAAPRIEIYTQNNGSPIPAAVADQIFEPFVTTKPAGTGLGLAIARNVAFAHGGSLELTDNQQDKIRFTLTIPFRACPPANTVPSIANPREANDSTSPAHNFIVSRERI